MPCAVMSWHRPNSWDAMDAEPRPLACRQPPPGTASQDESMSVSERQWPFVVSPGGGPWTGAEKPRCLFRKSVTSKTSCPRRRASSSHGAHSLDSRFRGNDGRPQALAVYLRNRHLVPHVAALGRLVTVCLRQDHCDSCRTGSTMLGWRASLAKGLL